MPNLSKIVLVSCILSVFASCNEHTERLPIENTALFTNVPTDYSGINFVNSVNQTRENNHMINSQFISGGGVSVGDINNDGLQDIFFAGNQVSDRLFLNKGTLKFEDISKKSGISTDNNWSTGVTFVDIDCDGDQDIYVCRFTYLENEKSANQLYINNGDLTFTEQAFQFGLADKGFSIQPLFFDFDNDGLVDVYIINQPPSIPNIGNKLNPKSFSDILFSDRLYKNNGDGKFVDYTEKAKIRNFGFGLSVSSGDFNDDGWQDLYVTNDFDVADHMYMNQKDGTFKDMIKETTKHISNFSMGSDIADYDNDGKLDLMVVDMMAENHKRIKTNMGGMSPEIFWENVGAGKHYQYMFNTLQRNNGNGTFSDLAQLGGVTSTDWSWAPLFADFDNDGYKDLFITNGIKSNNRNSDLVATYDEIVNVKRKEAERKGLNPNEAIDVMDFVNIAPTDKIANYIYKNNGDLTFSNKIKEWGMDIPTLSNGAAYADFDLDGDLDLVINNIDENAMLFKNNAIENELGNFLRFRIEVTKDQIVYGTKITLFKNDNIWQTNQLSNARGYMSKSENILHFGVDTTEIIEKVVIEWQDGSTTTLNNLEANQVHRISLADTDKEIWNKPLPANVLFREVTATLDLDKVKHQENEYDDYVEEVLLPHKMSQFGPSIAVGDVNGDGLEDFYLGGAAGFSGSLQIQHKNKTFEAISNGAWTQDKGSEDMGSVLIDIDSDNDLDLIVVSGGNEFKEGDAALQDRLYINNGKGKFKKQLNGLPAYLTSGSCIVPNDFDKDGDLDLFIGGRLLPQKYPHAANSHLLENVGGKFVDVTNEKFPDLSNLGMVTSASWFDYNLDGLDDLVVVGEWMPVTVFTQSDQGKFSKVPIKGLENSEGWYYSVVTADMDNDGDDDIIVGNLGLNYKYKASTNEPFEVHSYDFDKNGSLDIVLSYYEHGVAFPVRGKSCSTQQIPSLGNKFQSFQQFGDSNLGGIYGEALDAALNLKAKTFASAYIENKGEGSFEIKPLPALAQVSSINSILSKDFDGDGHKDLLVVGNLYPVEVETPRNDASTGLFLKGDSKGNFVPISIEKSGFFAPNDAKDMKVINIGALEFVLVGNNDDFLQVLKFE